MKATIGRIVHVMRPSVLDDRGLRCVPAIVRGAEDERGHINVTAFPDDCDCEKLDQVPRDEQHHVTRTWHWPERDE